jgi:replicative DNA helicase
MPGQLGVFLAYPGIGKSWWWLQDALETAIKDYPVKYWCGEMRRYQIMMRLYQLLGVDGHAMKTGKMTADDWDKLQDAKALIMNSPLFLDDRPLNLNEVRPMLIKEIAEHGLVQVIFDYESLIAAPGKDETEQSANTSRELKNITQDLDISVVLISSVNKGGMDTGAEFASKANVRGSGQKLHDADIVYMMTKFDTKYALDYHVKPDEYDYTILKKIKKGRELVGIENGFLVYQREITSAAGAMRKTFNPRFTEIKKG